MRCHALIVFSLRARRFSFGSSWRLLQAYANIINRQFLAANCEILHLARKAKRPEWASSCWRIFSKRSSNHCAIDIGEANKVDEIAIDFDVG
jgi:hypothetical protein